MKRLQEEHPQAQPNFTRSYVKKSVRMLALIRFYKSDGSLNSRSALTFLCGIYVYGVTWILLGQSNEKALSPNVWKQFMVSVIHNCECNHATTSTVVL